MLIGAGTERLVVLDPAADVEVRTVPVDNGDAISTLTGCGRTAWLFGAERAEARLHRF